MQESLGNFDPLVLTRDLDRIKAKVFLSQNAAFLGSVMCSMSLLWTEEVNTAGVDGLYLYWNPFWFYKIPEETRRTVFLHELWHIARMHGPRRGNRDPKIWNYACDLRINNDLEDEGYTFTGTNPWKDQRFSGWVEEDIYDFLIANPEYSPSGDGSWDPNGEADMLEGEDDNIADIVAAVVQASHQAKMSGEPGSMPGDVEEIIKQFLAPVIPWEAQLYRWMGDQLDTSYSWQRPNRRYSDMYMPSPYHDDGRLEHLVYYWDVSGSITHAQAVRFNSEVKYVKDTFNPAKMSLVLFDTVIQRVYEITEEDPFDEVEIVGRGGTSLVCVRNHIEEVKPTAAIIFSDLLVEEMEPLTVPIPVLWVAVGNPTATVPFGELIHIRG